MVFSTMPIKCKKQKHGQEWKFAGDLRVESKTVSPRTNVGVGVGVYGGVCAC